MDKIREIVTSNFDCLSGSLGLKNRICFGERFISETVTLMLLPTGNG